MDKKGVELSVNVIIVAAIALLVLVVLAFLLLQQAGVFNQGTTCSGVSGGTCKAQCDDGEKVLPYACPKQGDDTQLCCKQLFE